ncbi:uncharacterized protein ColSpa_05429 [Colletotrichum spaethianum]|uniref:Uncharacterized protein n=1 Tax=Colletotrichum spaethianum TaxID=700344 RepID=A0AA37P1R6_9PEZI|nr:uncharacterized protein ColSpa_05429 [Colletotrichum spaethianum]GKT45248.1 hypothetical protein ColSpa_05429 [Colletotrichum spaethianum]
MCVHTVTENEQLLALARRDLAKQRQQVVRDTLGVLAHEAGRVSTAGVEVSQESAVEVLKGLAGLLELVALGLDVVGDDLLDKGLVFAEEHGRAEEGVYLEGGEVDDAVDLGVLLEDGIEAGLVGNVDLVEVGALAAQELDAVDGDLGRVVEAVDNDHIVAVLEQGEGGEGANVAGTTASHQDARLAIARFVVLRQQRHDSGSSSWTAAGLPEPVVV